MFTIHEYINIWNEIFFSQQPASAVALTRIGIGLCAAFTFLGFLINDKYISLFFGQAGSVSYKTFLSNKFLQNNLCVFKLMAPTMGSVYIVLYAGFVSSVMMCLGLFTSLSSLVCYVCFTSLCHRNPWVFHSGDSLLRIMLFFLIFSRGGDELSFDCYLSGQSMINNLGYPWCDRIMQLLICCMYFKTISWKLYNKVWISGEALYFPLKMKSMVRFNISDKILPIWLIRCGTWSVLLSQAFICAAFFVKELRFISVCLGIILHLCFHALLRLDLFSFIVIASLLIYVPNEYIILVYKYFLG